jgi:hypothetical protein
MAVARNENTHFVLGRQRKPCNSTVAMSNRSCRCLELESLEVNVLKESTREVIEALRSAPIELISSVSSVEKGPLHTYPKQNTASAVPQMIAMRDV